LTNTGPSGVTATGAAGCRFGMPAAHAPNTAANWSWLNVAFAGGAFAGGGTGGVCGVVGWVGAGPVPGVVGSGTVAPS
jgi:hypothetical protein